ncbi:MAG: sensor histidine kinase [Bacteroidota bacterium]
MMKNYRITLLIIGFFVLAALLNEHQPKQMAELVKASVFVNPLSSATGGNISTLQAEIGAIDQSSVLTYGLITLAIIGGLLLIFFLRVQRTKKIISVQNAKLTKQQEELGQAWKELEDALMNESEARKALEDANKKLKSSQSQLIHAEKMSSIGMLTAGIAHEINNPVGFIKGGIETLKLAISDMYAIIEDYHSIKDDGETDVKQTLFGMQAAAKPIYAETKEMVVQLFKDILFGTGRVTEIVDGLRVFSRHDEAKIKNTNVKENLESALMILKHKCKNRAEIITNYDSNVGNIDCFPGQLNQVFVNLISNAVDAMKTFGTLIISTHDLGNKIQISFKDNGCGIPDEVLDKIFDPFFSTKDVGEGTGLGLSICHSIIEQHKGTMQVFSTVGVGTEFVLTLMKELDEEKEDGAEEKSEIVESSNVENQLDAVA